MKPFHAAAWALLACLGCGGGGGPFTYSANPPGPTVGGYEGPWWGTLTSSISGTVVTARVLVLSTGEMRYGASDGVQATGTLTVTGSAISAAGVLYAPTGAVTRPFTLSGTGGANAFGPTISGTYASAGDSGTCYFTYDNAALYTTPVNLANAAGAYLSVATSSGTFLTGRLSSTGDLAGSDAAGTFAGSLAVIDPAKNAFRVTATYTPAGQAAQAYSGLAFFESASTPLHLFLQATGSTGQFAADVERTGP